jgi:hypothetical protein
MKHHPMDTSRLQHIGQSRRTQWPVDEPKFLPAETQLCCTLASTFERAFQRWLLS